MVWIHDPISNTTQNLSIEGHWCQPVTGSEKLANEACKLQSIERAVYKSNSWIMCWCRQEVTHCRRALMYPTSTTWNEANDFLEVKTIWRHKVQEWRSWKMKVEGIAVDEALTGFVVSQLNDFSWTCRRHWDGLVALTPKDGWCERPMAGWLVNGIIQPNSIMVMKWKCHVEEKLATINSSSFFPFSPVIADQYLFIFVELEEDNICLFYNYPFGQTYCYLIF